MRVVTYRFYFSNVAFSFILPGKISARHTHQRQAKEVAPAVHGGKAALETQALAEKDADGDAKLVQDADGPANADGRNVRKVHGGDDRGHAAANPDKEATCQGSKVAMTENRQAKLVGRVRTTIMRKTSLWGCRLAASVPANTYRQ